MTSSGSLKDLAKAVNVFLQAPSLPIPAELDAVVHSYLTKKEGADSNDGERLNDELLSIYEKTVADHPNKYAPFLAVLRVLRPAFATPARTFEWWDRLLDPVLQWVSQEKGLAREVLNHTLEVLSIDESYDAETWNVAGSVSFTDRLLKRWVEACESEPQARSPSDLKEKMTRETLMVFGKKDPKGFMLSLNNLVVKRDSRNLAFSLLCNFVSSQPPHLHLILQTPLFVNILQSLQKDDSTVTVNLALVALIMLLPFMPSSLVPLLPTLFNIYARLLFWDRDTYFAQEHTEIGAEHGDSWEKCLLDPDYDGRSIFYLSGYFTILYGLYPINFVDYIRKPQRYLRHANNAEDIDVQATEIRDRSERFRKHHLLHPNFYNLTIESEKSDLSRWIKSEADEVLADCMALALQPGPGSADIGSSAPLPAVALFNLDVGDREGVDSALLGSSDDGAGPPYQVHPTDTYTGSHTGSRATSKMERRGSESSHPPSGRESLDMKTRDVGGDSPTLPPHLIHTPSHTQLQDMIRSNKVIKSSLSQSLANDSVMSLALSPQESVAEKSPSRPPLPSQPAQAHSGPSAESSDQSSLFYHQRLLLLNDLQYERYIKQQHMIHMGELRRKQVREAATEAETQNLVMANRSLRQRLDEAKRGEAQVKKEFDHRRNMTQKRESDLMAKLRTLREEQKKWGSEVTELKKELDAAHAECESLRRIVNEAEEKRLASEQNLTAFEISADEIEGLRAEISRLSASERAFQGKELKVRSALQEAEDAKGRAEQLAIELAALEGQLQQSRARYESQIADLNTKLAKTLDDTQRTRASEASALFESALAASRAKQSELQKQYSMLMRKYTVLQSSLLDMQCDAMEKKAAGNDTDGDADLAAMAASPPISIRNRPQRGFSDPEAFDGISHNATPPLDPVSSSVGAGRPSTPLGGHDASGKTSPHAERYFGRGGVQNAIKKERKDKKDDKADKKDKKTASGLRGIRSFV
ncbi:Hamartin protein-domain-containing protein [Lasiosphaeria ovina]|uniref:Hamartin protein-domain-containing protein n=1 Tax=Lasiosphaeria ovina TaxID=92902 RepID=A0AAE0NEB4_9PEZI|nr:Hamartin protein-domain-containing protein [Lasiosphaeria ovina]